jgi:hypothetical protein
MWPAINSHVCTANAVKLWQPPPDSLLPPRQPAGLLFPDFCGIANRANASFVGNIN